MLASHPGLCSLDSRLQGHEGSETRLPRGRENLNHTKGRLGTSMLASGCPRNLGGTDLNETLRRALLQAQLSEDDVAALLAVDPRPFAAGWKAAHPTYATAGSWHAYLADMSRICGRNLRRTASAC